MLPCCTFSCTYTLVMMTTYDDDEDEDEDEDDEKKIMMLMMPLMTLMTMTMMMMMNMLMKPKFRFSPLPVFNSAITSNSMFASLSETRHHVFPPHFSWLNWFVCCFLAKHSVQYLKTCPRSPERIVLRLQLLLATSLKMLFPNFEKTKLSPGKTCVCAKLHGSISSKLSRKMPRFPRSSLAQWPHVAPRPSW